MFEHWHWGYLWGIAAALNLYYHLFLYFVDVTQGRLDNNSK